MRFHVKLDPNREMFWKQIGQCRCKATFIPLDYNARFLLDGIRGVEIPYAPVDMSCHSRTTELNFQSILLIELIETSHILLINLEKNGK